MKLPDFEPGLLAVIVGGSLIKLVTSKRLTMWSGLVTVVTAVFCAVVFTDPIAHVLNVQESSLRYAICALLVFTGEGIVRFIIDLTSDQQSLRTFIVDAIRAWRGK